MKGIKYGDKNCSNNKSKPDKSNHSGRLQADACGLRYALNEFEHIDVIGEAESGEAGIEFIKKKNLMLF